MKTYRKYFPVTKKYIYFNHAGVSPLNTYTIEHLNNFIKEYVTNGSINYKKWLSNANVIRGMAADLINANNDEIAIIKNTTSGVLLVANGLNFKKGDNIIIPKKEFPANVYPWLNLKKKGVNVKFANWSEGRVRIKDLLNLIDNRTRLLSISHVQFTNGFRIDLEELGHQLKKKGVLFFVDAIQSMGVFDIDVKRDNIDYLAADSHKWLLGPEGVGFFYCKKGFLTKKMGTDNLEMSNFGYTSVVNSDDYLDYDMTLKPNAARFEEGSLNMLGVHAVLGSLKLINKVSSEKIRNNILSLTDYIVLNLKKKGFEIKSPREHENEKSGIVSFISKKRKSRDIYKRLMQNNCYVALRDNAIRISPHFYNTKEEADRFLGLLL
jgi:selenocysteine lyase/cysteine desulfurase